jgi:hypothetical protein
MACGASRFLDCICFDTQPLIQYAAINKTAVNPKRDGAHGMQTAHYSAAIRVDLYGPRPLSALDQSTMEFLAYDWLSLQALLKRRALMNSQVRLKRRDAGDQLRRRR